MCNVTEEMCNYIILAYCYYFCYPIFGNELPFTKVLNIFSTVNASSKKLLYYWLVYYKLFFIIVKLFNYTFSKRTKYLPNTIP